MPNLPPKLDTPSLARAGTSPSTVSPPEERPAPKRRRRQLENQVERLVEARATREEERQELGIGLRPLIMCGLPLRKRKDPFYSRRSGSYLVDLISHPQYGVPYGQDRLIPIFLGTLFSTLGCPSDNRVEFLYARDILRIFDLPLDGRHYQRLKDGFRRWKKTLISIERVTVGLKGRVLEENAALCLLPKSRLWFQEQEEKDDIPNEVWLSPQLADEIRKHPIPIDLQTIRALASFPGALDFYQWQVWRSFAIQEATYVPLFTESGLIAQLGCLEGQPPKELRRLLSRWQARIRALWPDCPNEFSTDGNIFLLRPSKALGHMQANRFLLSLLRRYRERPQD